MLNAQCHAACGGPIPSSVEGPRVIPPFDRRRAAPMAQLQLRLNQPMCHGNAALTMSVGSDETFDSILQRFVVEKCRTEPLFEGIAPDDSEYDCSGSLPDIAAVAPTAQELESAGPDLTMFRLRFHGQRIHGAQTPAEVDVEDGDEIDVFLGQSNGYAHYPRNEEVFNTRKGALSYYAREVRQLRHGWQSAHRKAHEWLQRLLRHLQGVERGEEPRDVSGRDGRFADCSRQ